MGDGNTPNKRGGKRPSLKKAMHNAMQFPELLAVVDAWPVLPNAVKAGIVAMVEAVNARESSK